ncbi:MAG: AAA family ATPase [Candidatus Omnitrophica bacterium]|nr:AAA family ATPase [Candidatus Omnitrophota bacterium]
MARYELNLWDYWRIFRKRKWIIIAVFLSVMLSTFFYSYQQVSIYKVVTTIKIYARAPIAAISGTEITFWGARSTLESEIELIKSDQVLKQAVTRLKYVDEEIEWPELQNAITTLRSKIDTERVGNTDLVEIRAIDSNPREAMRIAMEVADAYIEENWRTKINEAKTTREFIERQLDITGTRLKNTEEALKELKEKGEAVGTVMPLQDKTARLELELSSLRERYTENHPKVLLLEEEIRLIQNQLKTLPEKELLFARLKRELKTDEDLYAMLKDKYAKAQIVEASKTKDVEIVNPPVQPKAPINSNRTRNIFIGGILGIVLGIVTCFVMESLDTSIGTIEDVEEYLKLPVLGVIPCIKLKEEKFAFWKKQAEGKDSDVQKLANYLVTHYRPKSAIAEAYRTLQSNIQFSGGGKQGKSFLFTSVDTKEGKTITTANCAVSFAQMGKKVLLIDADLRHPFIHKVFGIKKENGLHEVVAGTLKLDEAVNTVVDILVGEIKAEEILKKHGMENLSVLTSGRIHVNPSELLGSKKMGDLIKEAKEKFDVVLLDCAPVLPVSDTLVLTSKIDGVVLIYKIGKVGRGLLRRAKIQIESAKGKPIGVVLNNIRTSEIKMFSSYSYVKKDYYIK